jgi:hypothetical protein
MKDIKMNLEEEEEVAGTCECGNEPLDSIKCGEFLDYLRTRYLLKKDCASWSEQHEVKHTNFKTSPQELHLFF